MNKWAWNTFTVYNGKTASCHRVTPTIVPLDQFDTLHNSPEVLNDRKLMLQGKWPENRGCEYCKNIEMAGGMSDRLWHNMIPGETPKDFNLDQPIDRNLVTPSILEVYLDNTCDLACVYCLPHQSSKINNELVKYGANVIGLTPVEKNPNYLQYKELFFSWLGKNCSSLRRLSILGGEPFLQKDFWKLLEFLSQHKHPELTLSINSNLNCNADTLRKFIDIIKNLLIERRIKDVQVEASLDCWGPQAEFIRYGLSLNRWQENFEYLTKIKWLKLTVHQVLTSLSIGTAATLQEKIADYKKINPKIKQSYFLVDGPNDAIYQLTIFKSDIFKQQLNELLETFPVTTEWDKNNKNKLEGCVKYCHTGTHNEERLILFKNTLDQIDLRRNTNWKNLFPVVNQYFLDYNIK